MAADEPANDEDLLEVLGAGWLWVVPDRSDQPVAYLEGRPLDGGIHVEQLSVDPAWGRRGLGRALLEHVAALARDHGAAALTLTTFTEVPWNAPYYERLGFAVVPAAQQGPGLAAIVAAEVGRWPGAPPRVAMRRAV